METKYRLGQPVAFSESRHIEFKEVIGQNVTRPIIDVAERYAVSFLNAEGGRILWGIRDVDRVVTGVPLSPSDRDKVQLAVDDKLGGIQPPIDPTRFRLIFHPVEGGAADLTVVELRVPAGNSSEPYFMSSGFESYVRRNGSTVSLSGQRLTDWIRARLNSNAPTSAATTAIDPALAAVAQRVRRIFAGHGLSPAHWARFFEATKAPFSVSLSDLHSDSTLIAWLTEPKIKWIAETFLVRREWIDGEDDRIFEEQSYDKRPQEFLATISRHADAALYSDVPYRSEAWFLRKGIGSDWEKAHSRVFVVVRVPIAQLSNELTVFRYLTDFEPYQWAEGRAAVQLRAWARLLFISKHISCFGREVSLELSDQISSNAVFLHDVIENQVQHTRDDWWPEDVALYPSESVVAKSDHFFPAVIEFLKTHHLPFADSGRIGGM